MRRVVGQRPGSRRTGAAVTALLLAVVLAACGPSAPDGAAPVAVDPTPVPVGEAAPARDLPPESLPLPLSDLPILDPGWDQLPQERDGLLLGLGYPQGGEPVRFIAAREDGTVLWQAERPPSCTGFTLSRAGADVVAVLTDVAPGTETLSRTSATGYDLADGRLLWGPVSVPGPHQGPGAVFAAPAPGAAMGETGPRVALDPATGEVLATEDDATAVVGEYDGVVLTAAGGELVADGAHKWTVPLEAIGLASDPVALPTTTPAGTALVAERGERWGVLLDLATGEVLAEQVGSAAREPMSATLVTAGPEEVSGFPTTDGATANGPWQRPWPEARIVAAGNVFAYLRTGDQLRVVNAVTGADAVAFDDAVHDAAVPALVTDGGATVLDADRFLLVPTADPAIGG